MRPSRQTLRTPESGKTTRQAVKEAYRWFCIDSTSETLMQLCRLVYADLLGHPPTATGAIEAPGEYMKVDGPCVGLYLPVLNHCLVRGDLSRQAMVAVMGHELGHAYDRGLIATSYGEARAELFELAFAKRIFEYTGVDLQLPLSENSLLYPHRHWLLAQDSTALVDLFVDFDARRGELGLDWRDKWLGFLPW